MLRLVCTSDTHNRHKALTIPHGDVFIHAGDLTMSGDMKSIREGFAWMQDLPHRRVLFVPGNHDFAFERIPELIKTLATEFPRVEVLLDSEVTVDGLLFYGSPHQPFFRSWAFNFPLGPRGSAVAEATWDKIPDNTNVLVTHGPPFGVRDWNENGERVGCPFLDARLKRLSELRLHVFGHIHEAYGLSQLDDRLYANVSACDVQYRAVQQPVVIDVDKNGATEVMPVSDPFR